MNNRNKYLSPIFILGMNGSGTTMLADCLNHHPLIYIHKIESRIIPYYYYNLKKYGDLTIEKNFLKLLRDFSNNSAFRLCNKSKKVEILLENNQIDDKCLSKAIDLTFSYFSLKQGKSIWGDHSPKHASFIPELIHLFPKAKIIHIIRDGRDCAYSFNRRFSQNIYRTIYEWKRLVHKAKTDGVIAGEKRYFQVKYEDLTNNSELFMNNICTFLDVPFDKSVLISNMPTFDYKIKNLMDEQLNTIIPNSGKWQKYFNQKQIRKMEKIAGTTLEENGYETLFIAGNDDISSGKFFYWKFIDKINAFITFYKEYKGKDKVGTLIRAIRTSLMQDKAFRNKNFH